MFFCMWGDDKMIIAEEYSNDAEYGRILRQTLMKAQKNVSKKQIDERKTKLIEKIKNQPLWSEIRLSIVFSKDEGNTKLNLLQYVQDPNSAVIEKLLAIFIDIIAFYELTIEGKLMPLCLDINNIFELNITHSKGNSVFKIMFNEVKYTKFLVINN